MKDSGSSDPKILLVAGTLFAGVAFLKVARRALVRPRPKVAEGKTFGETEPNSALIRPLEELLH